MIENFEKTIEIIKINIDGLIADQLSLYFGKKGRKNNERYYSFNEGMKNHEVSGELLTFLKDNLNTLIKSEISLNFNEDAPENYVCFNLEDIKVWNQFEPVVYRDNVDKFKYVDDEDKTRFNKNFRKVSSLKKLKYQINHYLLIYESDNFIIGQISKIYPKQVLHTPKRQFIFENDKFTEIKSEPNIEIDEHDSILFFINKDHKLGFTKHKKEYEDIFDMNLQMKIDALNTVKNSKFKTHCEINNVEEIIKKDLTIQRMLNNPVTRLAFDEFDIKNFKEVYDDIDDINLFNFKFENDKFILNKKDGKKSLRDIIKFIGHYYNYSLDRGAIIEGTPKGIMELNKNTRE